MGRLTERDALNLAVGRAVRAGRDDAVRLLQDFVRVPSVTGEEGAMAAVAAAAFAEAGLVVEQVSATPELIAPYRDHVGDETRFANRPNVVGIRRGAGGGRSILLNAHIDTVENGERATWTHDPNGGEIVGDRLYGRGACDMKGGLVTHLAALAALDAVGVRLMGDVYVAVTVGEEDGGVGALTVVLSGYKADAALITEPTRLALVPAQGGSLVCRITVPGSAAHACVRDEGVSAFEKFLPIFADLMALERERNAAIDHPLYRHIANKIPINFGVVRAGNWASTVPESLVAEGRIGLIAGEEVEPFREFIRDRIMAMANQDPWLREHPPTIEWFGGQFAPAEVPVDAPICRAVIAAHERATGSKPDVEGVTYGADMRLFSLIGGMPCVMYGAGDVNHAHRADEHIAILDLLTATRTIAHLLIDWCGVAE
jgi:acetylornithine deacetylase